MTESFRLQYLTILKNLNELQVSELSPVDITQAIRGKLFFFMDFILSKHDLFAESKEPEDFANVTLLLTKYLEFAVSYLKDFPNYIESVIAMISLQ